MKKFSKRHQRQINAVWDGHTTDGIEDMGAHGVSVHETASDGDSGGSYRYDAEIKSWIRIAGNGPEVIGLITLGRATIKLMIKK